VIRLDFIRPGHLVEDCFIESFKRPHRGLGQLPPAKFAALFTLEEGLSSTATLRC